MNKSNFISRLNTAISPYVLVQTINSPNCYITTDRYFKLTISDSHAELYICDDLIYRCNLKDDDEPLSSSHIRKYITRKLYRMIYCRYGNFKIYSIVFDTLTHCTYTMAYLVKVLNDGICNNELKLDMSANFADGDRYTIYPEHIGNGFIEFEVNYRGEPLVKIKSYAELVNANNLVKSGLIKYCESHIKWLNKKLDEITTLKESLK